MASAAAQKYFASFIPEQQAAIRDSWGGQDKMDEWFQNALDAGTVKPDGTPNQGQGATQASQAAGGMTPEKLRQHAKANNWSEDYARFDDNVLQGWINSHWDPAKKKFRSMHAPEGATGDWIYVEKPDEGIVDPSGIEYGPHGNKVGVNLSALGLNTLKGSIRTGGGPGGGGQGAGPAGPTGQYYGQDDPLQRYLTSMFGRGGGFFGQQGGQQEGAALQGGGIWWAPQSGDYSMAGVTSPAAPKKGPKYGNQGIPSVEQALPTDPSALAPAPQPGAPFVSPQPADVGNPNLNLINQGAGVPNYKRDTIETNLQKNFFTGRGAGGGSAF